VGLSGADLTLRAREQAVRFGAEILVPAEVVGVRRADPYTVVRLEDGSEVSASSLLIATGVRYRTLDVPGAAGLTGVGVYYGAGQAEGVDHEGGRVFVVGGGNSAGQAALFLAQFAASATLLVRGGDLTATMSRYLIDRLTASEKISIEYRTEVAGALGTRRLEGLRLRSGTDEREVAADALFVFIGQAPRTAWLDGLVRRDEPGFVLTGVDLGPSPPDWPLTVPPLPLETSVPGVFAAGDVRHGSGNRIAAAVGEGAMAVRFAHQRLSGR
jgi:thioredoxin reductase (NADPH)